VPVGLLQRHGLLLGPLPLAQLEAARPWLHDGALKALVHVAVDANTEAVLAELAALPRERVGVCVTLDAPSASVDVDAVAPVAVALAAGASTVLIRLVGAGQEEATIVAFGKELHQATKPKGGESIKNEGVDQLISR
jgi:hypothetical protein